MVSGRLARPSRSLQHRAIALVVVSLFTFQLSRNFLVIELDRFICLEPTHTHGVGSGASGHHHDDAEAVPHSHDSGHDSGYVIQHCKDSFGDIALTPVQPLDAPVMASYPPPPGSRTVLASQRYQAVENDLAPPFQPPRILS
ncbi:MAG: hypothetical protein HY649_03690 [Acidobacteria bacterium]|nr:hypothetical protein [Acidobacteriota bacterium]